MIQENNGQIKETKRRPRTASVRAKKAIANLLGKNGKPKSAAKAMKEAGYSDNYADNPQLFFSTKSAQAEIIPILDRLSELRDRAIAAMSRANLDKYHASDLMSIIKGLTHDIQLLSGNKTEDYGIEELSNKMERLINESKNDKRSTKKAS